MGVLSSHLERCKVGWMWIVLEKETNGRVGAVAVRIIRAAVVSNLAMMNSNRLRAGDVVARRMGAM